MTFSFNCYGHSNVLSLHRNTLEFTKDSELSKDGDCIVGVRADFDYGKLMEFIEENKDKKIICEISVDDISDEFSFVVNPDFKDEHEIVIRKSEFNSTRTLGFNVDKAAKDINRDLIEKLKNKDKKMKVIFRAEQ